MISQNDLDDLIQAGQSALTAAGSLSTLDEIEAEVVGKKSKFIELSKQLGGMSVDEKKQWGAAINSAKSQLVALASARREELSAVERLKVLESERLDLNEVVGDIPTGHLHVVTQAQMELEDVFIGMGFEVVEGPEVESDWNNFEALNFKPGHPARNAQDSFHVDTAEDGQAVLRTHTSPMQIRSMTKGSEFYREPPIYIVIPGATYRRDTADARHLPYFHQIEGLVVDKGISFADLAGTIETFIHGYFGANIETRFRPASFPFTEPSAEFEITCYFCSGVGCRVCSNVGWIELGGAGMVDPNVFVNCGLDPEVWTGFAFGFGIDRLPMMRHGIDDLRRLIENDVRFVSQF